MLRLLRIGSSENVIMYDDADYDSAIETDQPIKAGTPVDLNDVVRLEDLNNIILPPVPVVSIDNPTELNSLIGKVGSLVVAYQENAAAADEYTLYAYDSDGPAVSAPYIMDAGGTGGSERWIAIAGKYRISIIMNVLPTKNPPVDADKVIYRDSTAADGLVTSTWTQVKAFLKTYFDTIYSAAAHALSSHSDTNLAGLANNDLIQWHDPSSKWLARDIAEVINNQNINPGNVNLGDLTNYLNLSNSDGQITWAGTFLKKLTIRPNLDQTTALAGGTPTEVTRGLNRGYSLPIWSSPAGVNEELSFRMRVPLRWDGITDPQVGLAVSLSAAEDVGDHFKFSLEWQTVNKGDVLGTTTSVCYSEQAVLAGRADAYDIYFVFLTLDASDANNHIQPNHMLQCRLRRIDATDPDVSNEIIVWGWAAMWAVDKAYSDWSVETNDT